VFICPDPFRGGDHKLVLCECLAPDLTPIPTNTRNAAEATFNRKLGEEPW
jgi:glutamine synthetase